MLFAQYDLVTPYYHRHKYDGTITNNIVYPLTRSLYGVSVRQPIGGEFGYVGPAVPPVSRTTRLGDRRRAIWHRHLDDHHRHRGRLSGLSELSRRKASRPERPWRLSERHAEAGRGQRVHVDAGVRGCLEGCFSSTPTELFGFQFEVGVEPIPVRVDRMAGAFRQGYQDLEEIWPFALRPSTFAAVRELASSPDDGPLCFPDPLWVDVIFDFACAFKRQPVERGNLLSALAPLYLGRVASTVNEMERLSAPEVEAAIERLCVLFESAKPGLSRNGTT